MPLVFKLNSRSVWLLNPSSCWSRGFASPRAVVALTSRGDDVTESLATALKRVWFFSTSPVSKIWRMLKPIWFTSIFL